MAENKEALKKDLRLIIKLNSKLKYSNKIEVEKIYTTIIEKNIFTTIAGQKYVKGLESILDGNNTSACIFCGKEASSTSVICSECLSKFQPIMVDKPEKDTAIPAVKTISYTTVNKEKIEKAKDTAISSVKTISDAIVNKENIEKVKDTAISSVKTVSDAIRNKENIEKAKDEAKKMLNKADEKIHELDEKMEIQKKAISFGDRLKNFWEKRSKKQKIFIVCVFGILIISLFAGGNAGSSIGKGNLSNEDDAYKLVSSLYPESEYSIDSTGKVTYPYLDMYKVEVGSYIGDSWVNDDTCKAYVFSVMSKGKEGYATLWVNTEGKIIGYGPLISGQNEDITQPYRQYRIR